MTITSNIICLCHETITIFSWSTRHPFPTFQKAKRTNSFNDELLRFTFSLEHITRASALRLDCYTPYCSISLHEPHNERSPKLNPTVNRLNITPVGRCYKFCTIRDNGGGRSPDPHRQGNKRGFVNWRAVNQPFARVRRAPCGVFFHRELESDRSRANAFNDSSRRLPSALGRRGKTRVWKNIYWRIVYMATIPYFDRTLFFGPATVRSSKPFEF